MSFGNILKTKIHVPQQRQGIISRPRLLECFNKSKEKKIIFLSAPVGFGKSTIITDWISDTDKAVCWVSLDETENDPINFLLYFIASVQTILPEFCVTILPNILSPGTSNPSQSLISIINELTDIKEDVVLVLDDFHCLTDHEISSIIEMLTDHQPPTLQLIIASRNRYPNYFSRYIACGEMMHISQSDLRFNDSEVNEYLKENFWRIQYF